MDRVLAQFDDLHPVPTASPDVRAWTGRDPLRGHAPVLVKSLPDTAALRARATQALALSHPRIVPTRRWLRDEGHVYVVRDFVPGSNLRGALADLSRRAFSLLQTLLSPVLDALDYAHRAGLPHGAVTPENVIVGDDGNSLLSDFGATDNEGDAHGGYVPRALLLPDGQPTPRADFYALCELYKEFLPARADDDEAGAAARARLLRNLTETQQTARSADELRYKLDAVAKMADLLGFSAPHDETAGTPRRGARLVCAVSPPTALLSPGGGTGVVLSVHNEGDTALHVEAVGSDVVWLNPSVRFTPFDLAPDLRRSVGFTLSGARLAAGNAYTPHILVRSNHEMLTPAPPAGESWHEMTVAVPVLVSGPPETDAPPPLAESLPPESETPPPPSAAPNGSAQEHPGIAVTQEPDPGLTRAGQTGVLHLGVKNIGPARLRIDKLRTSPPWLVYPGAFQALWIEPGATEHLGFSVLAANLPGGDFKGQVTFTTSVMTETLIGAQPSWRELACDVRVRVVRGAEAAGLPDLSKAAGGSGCAPVLLALVSAGLLTLWHFGGR